MENQNLDLLKKIEELTAKMNDLFAERTKSVFERYPMTFALLVVFGVTMVTQSIGYILESLPFFSDNPWVMLVAGITVLVFTGTLYKKLNR